MNWNRWDRIQLRTLQASQIDTFLEYDEELIFRNLSSTTNNFFQRLALLTWMRARAVISSDRMFDACNHLDADSNGYWVFDYCGREKKGFAGDITISMWVQTQLLCYNRGGCNLNRSHKSFVQNSL